MKIDEIRTSLVAIRSIISGLNNQIGSGVPHEELISKISHVKQQLKTIKEYTLMLGSPNKTDIRNLSMVKKSSSGAVINSRYLSRDEYLVFKAVADTNLDIKELEQRFNKSLSSPVRFNSSENYIKQVDFTVLKELASLYSLKSNLVSLDLRDLIGRINPQASQGYAILAEVIVDSLGKGNSTSAFSALSKRYMSRYSNKMYKTDLKPYSDIVVSCEKEFSRLLFGSSYREK